MLLLRLQGPAIKRRLAFTSRSDLCLSVTQQSDGGIRHFGLVHNQHARRKVIRRYVGINTIDWSSVWTLTEINPAILVVFLCVFFHAIFSWVWEPGNVPTFPHCRNLYTTLAAQSGSRINVLLQHINFQAQFWFFFVSFFLVAGVVWFPSSRWSSSPRRSQFQQSVAKASDHIHGTNLLWGSFLCLLLNCYCVLLIFAKIQSTLPPVAVTGTAKLLVIMSDVQDDIQP